MNYIEIDMVQYERKEHFALFNSMANPYVGVTLQIDITDFLQRIRRENTPFFFTFLFEIVQAANSIPEFRQRIVDNRIIELENCLAGYTVSLENGTYCHCTLDCTMPFDKYIPYATDCQRLAVENPTLKNRIDPIYLFFISCSTRLSYTGLTLPTPVPADSIPRITWGRYYRQGDRMLIPVSVLVNHALADAYHISLFYEKLEQLLAR